MPQPWGSIPQVCGAQRTHRRSSSLASSCAVVDSKRCAASVVPVLLTLPGLSEPRSAASRPVSWRRALRPLRGGGAPRRHASGEPGMRPRVPAILRSRRARRVQRRFRDRQHRAVDVGCTVREHRRSLDWVLGARDDQRAIRGRRAGKLRGRASTSPRQQTPTPPAKPCASAGSISASDDYYGLMVRFPSDWREPSPAGWASRSHSSTSRTSGELR